MPTFVLNSVSYTMKLWILLAVGSKEYVSYTRVGSTYTKILTIERRLAWPLHEEDTKSWNLPHFYVILFWQTLLNY